MQNDLLFFSEVRTSRGVYKPLKFAIDDFLELGERDTDLITSVMGAKDTSTKGSVPQTQTATQQDTNAFSIFEKNKLTDFADNFQEALHLLQNGLPNNVSLLVGISYSVNLIKPDEGKELLYFQALSYDGTTLQVKLTQTPEKVKYLKLDGVIKPSLEKIELFYFKED